MRGERGEGHRLTSSCVEAAPTAIAFEVFRLLVGYEDLEVVEVALAVEAPWALELLVEVRIPLPLFGHDGGRGTWGAGVDSAGGMERREGRKACMGAARRVRAASFEVATSVPNGG